MNSMTTGTDDMGQTLKTNNIVHIWDRDISKTVRQTEMVGEVYTFSRMHLQSEFLWITYLIYLQYSVTNSNRRPNPIICLLPYENQKRWGRGKQKLHQFNIWIFRFFQHINPWISFRMCIVWKHLSLKLTWQKVSSNKCSLVLKTVA